MRLSTRSLALLATLVLPSLGAPLTNVPIDNNQQVNFPMLNSTTSNSTSSFNSTGTNQTKSFSEKGSSDVQRGPFAMYNSAYSFDSDKSYHPRWMTWLPSGTNLTSLSIPGTHNSMTYDTSWYYQCQNANLTSQLNSGIRYLDIRARVVNNKLSLYHDDMPTHHSFTRVLTDVFDFLEHHPGEVILMRVKEEVGLTGGAINSTHSFQQAFADYLRKNPATKERAQKHIWIPEAVVDLYNVPPIGELRGKILILQDFGVDTAIAEFGLHWGSTLLAVEDAWNIPEKQALKLKENAIERNLMSAMNGTVGDGDGTLYVTYLSGSGGIESMNVAAGDNGVNDRIGRFLVGQKSTEGAVGVVVMDVPGAGLIEEILKRNPAGMDESNWTGLQIHSDA